MAKTARNSAMSRITDSTPQREHCSSCGRWMRLNYTIYRTVVTLCGVTQLNLAIRRCHNEGCAAWKRPYRPEAEGRFALPHYEFGLEVIALIDPLHCAEHRSVPEI